jgi:hypothetical protein
MFPLCIPPTWTSRKRNDSSFRLRIFQIFALGLLVSGCVTPYAHAGSPRSQKHILMAPRAAVELPNLAVKVVITPGSASVSSSATYSFYATVSNTGNTAVTWKASLGKISSSGLFTAPGVTTTTTSVVTATSVADRTAFATAIVTVTPVPPVSIDTTTLPTGLTGTLYSTVLTATGGIPPYTWNVSWGALPVGLTLSAGGTISGTTTATGAFTFNVHATDSSARPLKAKQVFTLNVNLNMGKNTVPSNFFNMHTGHPNTPWPSSPVAGQRLWDSGVSWPLINTAKGVYDWTQLDQRLSEAHIHKAELLYDMGMTPVWAQCGKATASSCIQASGCAFAGTSYGAGAGQCYWPADLNPDGTGSNQYWKDWVAALATHSVNSGTGHIKYYEIWNEPNDIGFWRGTTAQMIRMAQDAACIIKGIGPGCRNVALDPNALMVTPAPTLGGAAINTWMTEYLGGGGSQVSDVIAFHGYNGTNAEKISNLVSTLRNKALTTFSQTSKPLFDTEFSWGLNAVFPDQEERAGFVVRSLLLHWSAGVNRVYWYAWDASGTMWSATSTGGCTTPDASGVGFTCKSGLAFDQVQNWLVGATLSQACSVNGTVWTCGLTKPGGYQALAVWDTAQSCSNGLCTTSTFTFTPVSPNYIHRRDIYGAVTPISGRTVPIGYKPILLENQ